MFPRVTFLVFSYNIQESCFAIILHPISYITYRYTKPVLHLTLFQLHTTDVLFETITENFVHTVCNLNKVYV